VRYTYLGDKLTDPALVGAQCDPCRREDGKCIVSVKRASALVRFADGITRVVARRRLRVNRATVDNAGRRP
jgi:hypothetical protein